MGKDDENCSDVNEMIIQDMKVQIISENKCWIFAKINILTKVKKITKSEQITYISKICNDKEDIMQW